VPVLEWRRDVGDRGYLDGLVKLVGSPAASRQAPILSDAV
jgi:hypothetical protein